MKFFQKNSTGSSGEGSRIPKKPKKKIISIIFSKRQKFVIAVVLLSIGLFISGNIQTGTYALHIALSLAVITDFFLFWSVYRDIRESFTFSIFILPFFYSLSSGLFYFLIPANVFIRLIAVILYAFGLYSLFLSQNVFAVASIRTIALISGARIVSFVITLLSYFFITDITFSLRLPLWLVIPIVTVYTFFLVYQSIRSYTLQKADYPSVLQWSIGVTLCLLESVALLWFWPSSPTIIALFLAGFFYTLTGLSHIWFERRLFKSVLWEYVWVGVVVFLVLLGFTPWGK